MLRSILREPVKIGECDDPLPRWALNMHLCLKSCERHAHVGRMRRDASLAGAEDCVHAVEAFKGGATAAWLAFVARGCRVVKIIAARPLQEIAARRRHIAKLRGCARNDRA